MIIRQVPIKRKDINILTRRRTYNRGSKEMFNESKEGNAGKRPTKKLAIAKRRLKINSRIIFKTPVP